MPADPLTAPARRLTVLVVDDSTATRKMLALMLRKWGFEVLEAASGAEALAICEARNIDIAISDWLMPGMSGLELCRTLRARRAGHYIYFILLTSRSEKKHIVAGLDARADDFVIKPTEAIELRARLRAGQRLVRMQEDLFDKNRRVSEAFDRLHELYAEIDRDLRSAGQLQRALIPERHSTCGPFTIDVLYRPAGHVGGDLLGYFRTGPERLAAYAIDVSGHGVSSALMTTRLANFFTPHHPADNLGQRQAPDGTFLPRDPAEIAADLNERLQHDPDLGQYFTMLFADVDAATRTLRFCQAGHPNAAVLRADGRVEFVGDGGPPIGLIPDMPYKTTEIRLAPGDRFLAFSDGVTEAEDAEGAQLEEAGLADLLGHMPTDADVLDHLAAGLEAYCGTSGFSDDTSALLLSIG